jgi:hypothetical protein
MVRQSDSLWFTPMGAVRADVADGLLTMLEIPAAADQEAVGLLRRTGVDNDFLLDEFMRLLRENASLHA